MASVSPTGRNRSTHSQVLRELTRRGLRIAQPSAGWKRTFSSIEWIIEPRRNSLNPGAVHSVQVLHRVTKVKVRKSTYCSLEAVFWSLSRINAACYLQLQCAVKRLFVILFVCLFVGEGVYLFYILYICLENFTL